MKKTLALFLFFIFLIAPITESRGQTYDYVLVGFDPLKFDVTGSSSYFSFDIDDVKSQLSNSSGVTYYIQSVKLIVYVYIYASNQYSSYWSTSIVLNKDGNATTSCSHQAGYPEYSSQWYTDRYNSSYISTNYFYTHHYANFDTYQNYTIYVNYYLYYYCLIEYDAFSIAISNIVRFVFPLMSVFIAFEFHKRLGKIGFIIGFGLGMYVMFHSNQMDSFSVIIGVSIIIMLIYLEVKKYAKNKV